MRPVSRLMTVAALLAATALIPAAAIARPHGPPTQLDAGAVATSDVYGAQAAREIMRAGGNAADAAVAVAFVEAVTYPEAGNIGGGGLMTIMFNGKPYFLDYRETAPGKAGPDMYLDAKGEPITDLSLVGNLAAGVPGSVRGMSELHHRFARLSWARDMAPAIRLARKGFHVPKGLVAEINDSQDYFKTTNFSAYFGKTHVGALLKQPELAATLARISKEGPDEFYTGKTADLLVAQMQRGKIKGLITKADLAAYKPVWREPIVSDWRDMKVITAPPPSSGGVALLQLLQMKQDAAPLFDGISLNTPQYIHLISEIEKRVFADRAEYMGDPDFVKVPVSALIDPAYNARRARDIDPAKPSVTAGVKPGLEKHQTTHFSIIDKWGNAISNTYTLNGSFGAGTVVEGAGFVLNDEMDDFSVKPGAPNQFGVIGGEANAIAPGKRPLSSMTPTILTKDGKVSMVIGTPGGSRIFTWIFQMVADVYDYKLTLGNAQTQMRFHHQLFPENLIYSEPYATIGPDLTKALGERGYKVENQGWGGDIEAIQIIGRQPAPSSDPRARGYSLVIH